MRLTSWRIAQAASCAALLGLSTNTRAADEVVGAVELGVKHDLTKRWQLAVSGQVRADSTQVQSWLPEAQVLYEPVKRVTIGVGYRLSYARSEPAEEFETAHRLHAQVGFGLKLPSVPLKLKYRLRAQDSFASIEGQPTEHRPRLRNALELTGDDWALLSPFASVEHYLALDRLSDSPTRRWRWMLGVEKDLGSVTLQGYYRFDNRADEDDPDRHLLGLGVQWQL